MALQEFKPGQADTRRVVIYCKSRILMKTKNNNPCKWHCCFKNNLTLYMIKQSKRNCTSSVSKALIGNETLYFFLFFNNNNNTITIYNFLRYEHLDSRRSELVSGTYLSQRYPYMLFTIYYLQHIQVLFDSFVFLF